MKVRRWHLYMAAGAMSVFMVTLYIVLYSGYVMPVKFSMASRDDLDVWMPAAVHLVYSDIVDECEPGATSFACVRRIDSLEWLLVGDLVVRTMTGELLFFERWDAPVSSDDYCSGQVMPTYQFERLSKDESTFSFRHNAESYCLTLIHNEGSVWNIVYEDGGERGPALFLENDIRKKIDEKLTGFLKKAYGSDDRLDWELFLQQIR